MAACDQVRLSSGPAVAGIEVGQSGWLDLARRAERVLRSRKNVERNCMSSARMNVSKHAFERACILTRNFKQTGGRARNRQSAYRNFLIPKRTQRRIRRSCRDSGLPLGCQHTTCTTVSNTLSSQHFSHPSNTLSSQHFSHGGVPTSSFPNPNPNPLPQNHRRCFLSCALRSEQPVHTQNLKGPRK